MAPSKWRISFILARVVLNQFCYIFLKERLQFILPVKYIAVTMVLKIRADQLIFWNSIPPLSWEIRKKPHILKLIIDFKNKNWKKNWKEGIFRRNCSHKNRHIFDLVKPYTARLEKTCSIEDITQGIIKKHNGDMMRPSETLSISINLKMWGLTISITLKLSFVKQILNSKPIWDSNPLLSWLFRSQ